MKEVCSRSTRNNGIAVGSGSHKYDRFLPKGQLNYRVNLGGCALKSPTSSRITNG